MVVKLEFLKDFATKKKGDVWDCSNSILASNLVKSKVAKKRVRKTTKKEE